MALDHKLGPIERLSLKIIDIDSAVSVFLRHFGCILPGKEVLWAVFGADRRVQGAKLKAIEFAVHEDRRVFLVLALARESSVDSGRKLAEIVVVVNLHKVGLACGFRWRHPEADALIWRPHKSLQTFFGRLFPDKLSDGAACLGLDNAQIGMIWVV